MRFLGLGCRIVFALLSCPSGSNRTVSAFSQCTVCCCRRRFIFNQSVLLTSGRFCTLRLYCRQALGHLHEIFLRQAVDLMPHPGQCMLQRLIASSAPSVQHSVERVQKGVESWVYRQHEDSSEHVDFTGDEHLPAFIQNAHDPNREPTAEVSENDEEKSSGNGQLSLPVTQTTWSAHPAHCSVYAYLSNTNESKKDRVQNYEDREWILLAWFWACCEGKWDAYPTLAVKVDTKQ